MRIYRLNIFHIFVVFFTVLFFLSNNLEAKNQKKQWGNISIELKKTRFIGKNVQLEFVFENLSEVDDSFSSLLQLDECHQRLAVFERVFEAAMSRISSCHWSGKLLFGVFC